MIQARERNRLSGSRRRPAQSAMEQGACEPPRRIKINSRAGFSHHIRQEPPGQGATAVPQSARQLSNEPSHHRVLIVLSIFLKVEVISIRHNFESLPSMDLKRPSRSYRIIFKTFVAPPRQLFPRNRPCCSSYILMSDDKVLEHDIYVDSTS
jgi:hypothetical protein